MRRRRLSRGLAAAFAPARPARPPGLLARRLPGLLAGLGLGTLLALGGCSDQERFAPACPSLALLPDAADLTRFDGHGQDITDVVVDARITAVPAACKPDGPGKVRATLRVVMAVTRGPASSSRAASLPYFVAVTEAGRVLDEQDYAMAVSFPPNVDAAVPTGQPIDLVLPVTPQKSAAAYAVYVGFRLQPDELALNRKRGAR